MYFTSLRALLKISVIVHTRKLPATDTQLTQLCATYSLTVSSVVINCLVSLLLLKLVVLKLKMDEDGTSGVLTVDQFGFLDGTL